MAPIFKILVPTVALTAALSVGGTYLMLRGDLQPPETSKFGHSESASPDTPAINGPRLGDQVNERGQTWYFTVVADQFLGQDSIMGALSRPGALLTFPVFCNSTSSHQCPTYDSKRLDSLLRKDQIASSSLTNTDQPGRWYWQDYEPSSNYFSRRYCQDRLQKAHFAIQDSLGKSIGNVEVDQCLLEPASQVVTPYVREYLATAKPRDTTKYQEYFLVLHLKARLFTNFEDQIRIVEGDEANGTFWYQFDPDRIFQGAKFTMVNLQAFPEIRSLVEQELEQISVHPTLQG